MRAGFAILIGALASTIVHLLVLWVVVVPYLVLHETSAVNRAEIYSLLDGLSLLVFGWVSWGLYRLNWPFEPTRGRKPHA